MMSAIMLLMATIRWSCVTGPDWHLISFVYFYIIQPFTVVVVTLGMRNVSLHFIRHKAEDLSRGLY